jgi:hypothetical protein
MVLNVDGRCVAIDVQRISTHPTSDPVPYDISQPQTDSPTNRQADGLPHRFPDPVPHPAADGRAYQIPHGLSYC